MRLGVDFGTTTTAIAIVDRGNYPIVSFVNNNDDTVDFVMQILRGSINGEDPDLIEKKSGCSGSCSSCSGCS